MSNGRPERTRLSRPPYSAEVEDRRFPWTKCYESIADKLLSYRNDRQPLIKRIAATRSGNLVRNDRFPDGTNWS